MLSRSDVRQILRTERRLLELKQAAAKRLERSVDENDRLLDQRIVDDISVSLIYCERFRDMNRDVHDDQKVQGLEHLSAAVIHIWKLGDYLRSNMDQASSFHKRVLERVEQWLNMINISQLSFSLAIYSKSLSQSLGAITDRMAEKKMDGDEQPNPGDA